MSEPTTIYTAEELAVLLKQHVKTVQRKAKTGIYPHTRLGNEPKRTTKRSWRLASRRSWIPVRHARSFG